MNVAELRHYMFVKLGDPRVRDWPLMDEPWIILGIIVLYLLLVYKILPFYMKSRKAYKLKTLLTVYNFCQVAVCIALLYRAFNTGFYLKYLGCTWPDYSEKGYATAEIFWWYMMIKLVELMETCFFVLRKKYKQASPLHVYHHASTLGLSWMSCKYGAGGLLLFPTLLNTAVHVIMYSYYFLSCFGPEMQKILQPFKPRITQIQIIQLVILFFHAAQVMLPSCDIPWIVPVIGLPNYIVNIWNFKDFYQRMYVKKVQ